LFLVLFSFTQKTSLAVGRVVKLFLMRQNTENKGDNRTNGRRKKRRKDYCEAAH
jgi:hypothetical protein